MQKSPRESASWTALCEVMERQSRHLEALVASMRKEREAYVAARPSRLESAMDGLQQAADQVHALDAERERVVTALLAESGQGELARKRRHPRLRDLLPLCPANVRARLERAGQSVDRVARGVQVESRVGARLLESSRRVQLGLVDALCGVASREARAGAGAYGRDARYGSDGSGAGTRTRPASGRLVSGIA